MHRLDQPWGKVVGRPLDGSQVAQHIAIEQLLYQYGHAIDRPLSSPETLEERIRQIFHPEATIEYVGQDYSSPEPTLFRGPGPDGWFKYFRTWREMHQSKCRFNRHSTTNAVITLEDDCATATSYLTGGAYPISAESELYISHGIYYDELIKEGGRWWLYYRKIHILFVLRAQPEQYRNK